MPLIDDAVEVLGSRLRLPDADALSPDPSALDVFASAYRLENTLSSAIFRERSKADPIHGYDWKSDLEGYEEFAPRFIDVQSPDEAAVVKRRIDRENADRETLAAGGAMGFMASLAAGFSDPITIMSLALPGSQARGVMPLGVAIRTAIGGAAGAGITEAALHATQETRSPVESAIAVAGTAILGGILGGAAGSLEAKALKRLDDQLKRDLSPDASDVLTDDVRSMGAAARRATSKAEETLVASGLETIAKVNPLVRLMTSDSTTVRQVVQELAENAAVTAKNIAGVASATAVETLIKAYDARFAAHLDHLTKQFIQYRGKGRLASVWEDLHGVDKLDFDTFRREVSRALRNGDVHDIPEVAAHARWLRSNVFEPDKAVMQRLKILPEDLKVKGAASYLTRVWRTDIVRERREELQDLLVDYWSKQSKGALDAEQLTELRATARETVDNILKSPAGINPRNIVPRSQVVKERTLDVPDNLLAPYLEDDIDRVMRFYNRTVAPEIELTRRFGSVDMKDQASAIKDEYGVLVAKAKGDAKEVKALEARRDDDLRDLYALRDRLLGTYGAPADSHQFAVKASRAIRAANFLSMLGGMTISAIPDLARPVFQYGMRRYGKALVSMATAPSRFNLSRREAKKAAVGLDMILNTRAAAIADVGDYYGAWTKFDKGIEATQSAFSVATLMAPWNAALKQFVGVMAQDFILESADKIARGVRVSQADLTHLAQMGFDQSMLRRVAAQAAKHGDDVDGLRVGMADAWDDFDASEVYKAALLKEADTAIVTPGIADKPLWMSSELGKVVGQFKSFAFASTNRALLPALQRRDLAALNGTVLTMALGAMVYGIKERLAGREVSTDPKKVIVEALDRSGMTGYLGDVNNIMEKATRGVVGLSAVTGQGQMSRYASRGVLGAIAGPTVDQIDNLSKVTGAAATGEWAEGDVRAMRKLVPLQNLFYTRWLFDQAERAVADKVVLD